MFEKVRNSLLDEATQSPNLLSDLAGLEEIVAETYNARSFFELLQNSDDAGATRFLIRRIRDTLVVANNGRDFTPDDLESLCRSAASKKNRAESIGYRGIGFKSIVSFADEVAILSGSMRVFFSRAETKKAVKHTGRVPLIRVPHLLEDTNTFISYDATSDLNKEHFSTIFVFRGINERAIDVELTSFDESALLFLRSTEYIDFNWDKPRIIRVSREGIGETTQRVKLHSAQESSQWLLEKSGHIQLAMSYGNDIVQKLDDDQAVAHAFLPTNDRTGIGAKIQARTPPT